MSRQYDLIMQHGLIKDHNSEGFDSVDSEDFDAGFGCSVPLKKSIPYTPAMIDRRSELEKKISEENIFWQRETEQESNRRQDEFLASHGIK